MVPPAFTVYHGLYDALTGGPGSLTIESLRERLTPRGVDGEDFAAWPAASHHPAALCKGKRLLGSVHVISDYMDGIILELDKESR